MLVQRRGLLAISFLREMMCRSRQRDDGQDVPADGAWRRNEQSAGGFDGHRNPVVGIVAEGARHFQQFRQAGGYIFDASRGQQLALYVHKCHGNGNGCRAPGRCFRRCHGPDASDVGPFGEVPDGFGDFGRQGTGLVIDPGFEAVQLRVLVVWEEPLVHEQRPEVVSCPSWRIAMTVEALVGQGSPVA
ncbi:hypothetical protein FCN77_10750 [Arthrobacter sp. 24S4-2]|uniref:hypothetical protein n=1 Tax=Arthrobacter sp. 24S4-2 TaxID=2575374 RepID=UPI0010C77BAC|nr:hypothetical protein [Arthrobacter sp. 24S4-2]QCO98101.1 hypothetical protein FCN77_10750 [Arthrobacter sp. 24S4-2]